MGNYLGEPIMNFDENKAYGTSEDGKL